MGRRKVTGRRSQRGRLGFPGIGGRGRGYADISTASSNRSTPENEQNIFSGSETGISSMSLPARDLSDNLIDYVCQTQEAVEPPRKRPKTSSVSRDSREAELKHIVVKRSTWEIRLAGSRLAELQTPITRTNIPLYIHWTRNWGPEYVEIMDIAKSSVFHTLLPPKEDLEDVHLALLVHRDSKKWAKAQGRLWTEFDVSLDRKDGHDVLQFIFTVKWNTTSSPYDLSQASARPPGLSDVLEKYFPDPAITKEKPLELGLFYRSVHAPGKEDGLSDMSVENLVSDLYPFQKRAVQWLLRREGVEWSRDGVREFTASSHTQLPISFVQTKDALGQPCFVSHLFGLVTTDLKPFTDFERQLRGGILAEEMGLGKTVEMIALISLHQRPKEQLEQFYDLFTAQNLRPTKATLIIAPPFILQQWISEINRHAPHLVTFHYEGIKAHSKRKFEDLLDDLAVSDVVISTYSVLAAELFFTGLNPEKSLRRESKYPRPKSPLMMLSWWRCLIDEAQMIESGVSNAAVVARMIPRVNAWCVTGTPVRKDVNDLLGLLVFLRYEPFASIKHVWSFLLARHKQAFRQLFGALALRHSKQNVRDELKLPNQRRHVIRMPFTPIEEQHYKELFNQMCEESGLNAQGAPLADTWDPDAVSDVMRRWLVRLRQTALHPEVGGRNRRALGQKDGPLRTVDQVLDVMMEQTDVAIRTDQKALLSSKLKRGQLFENSPRVKEALTIWQGVVKEASEIVEECREQLRRELAGIVTEGKSTRKETRNDPESEDASDNEPEDVEQSSRLGALRNRLRGALELLHVAIFFRANTYYQIKSNEKMTEPESDDFKALEKLEIDGYEEAKKLRREILQEIFGQANKLMKKIAEGAATQVFVQIPECISNPPKGGLESRRIMEQFDELATALDAQANILDEWREKTIQFLLRPLVDEDEEVEITGDEYEDSTKTQDEVAVYVQALRSVIADRHDALTGQENKLVEFDAKVALRLAKDADGPAPDKMIELLGIRNEIKPTRQMGSLRGIVAELRALTTSLRPDAENGSDRAQNELTIVEKQLRITQKQLSEQMKATAALEKEVDLFSSVMNTRLQFYRQLQEVSDQVAPYEGPNDDLVHNRMLADEEKLARKIAVAKSKRRYLEHLRLEATNPQEQRICVICRETFEVGALTICGHQYCAECMRLWWNSHHNCPICKKKLILSDLHEITYKPQALSIETEEVHESDHERSSPSSKSRKSSIYSEFSMSKLAEIKNIELDSPSFGTKIDTLARHLIYLREADPGAKSIIYSQFKDYLLTLARAFERYRIGYSSIDKPNGIERFKHDPGIECFLLHARAHSSGLNLVNANHVFLCEPLLNTALELQAIARVDRIGQQQETNVWLYLVDGTVEENIHALSVQRRMENFGQRISSGKGKAKELSPDELLDTNLEEANSMEMQQASLTRLLAKGGKGGEMVEKEDLWECLFGGVSQRNSNRALVNSALGLDAEVGRYLSAEAAEERIAMQSGGN